MGKLQTPKGYKSKLSVRETEKAIKFVKDNFENNLANNLNLERVSAPLFVRPETGLNDNLNGIEKPVEFVIKDLSVKCQIVQSLAKWKRFALKKYGFAPNEGLYTDMNAIRPDELMDNLHSIYVDQWDWEKVITRETRNVEMLKDVVRKIVSAFIKTNEQVKKAYPQLAADIKEDVFFVTTQELEDMYPNLSIKERENAICKEKKTVFFMQIGDVLKSGIKHDGRAPDYDDWALNGDIFFWNETLQCAFEVSSMGIRVDEKSLAEQLKKANCEDRAKLPFHKALLNKELPLSIGGGIGQSRTCMLLLEKAHVGEVQASVWGDEYIAECEKAGIFLL